MPELTSLDRHDILFQQISNDIQSFYRWQAGNSLAPQLSLYQYRIRSGDSLFSLSARLNLPQSTIATINRLDSPELPTVGRLIIIPNIPGIFIPDEPASDFEKILSQRILSDESIELSERFIVPSSSPVAKQTSGIAWRFIVAGDFTGIERRAFLHVLFQDPLPTGYISSRYGLRESPITGKSQFHFGLDMAAPRGTSVLSTTEGRIVAMGHDNIYGQYVRIEHPGGYESLYAHLGIIAVEKNERVRSGQIIGRVGSSGLSTGSHLHFEILYLGENRNPQLYIHNKQ